MILQSAELGHDGRWIRMLFSAPVPPSRGAVDWKPGWQTGVQRTLSTPGNPDTKFYFRSGSCLIVGDNLVWEVYGLIRAPADRVTFGQTGITISAGAGLYQDAQGNGSAAFADFPVTNYSYVGSDGFAANIPVSGTGVTVYVSWANGDDSRTVAQAQVVTTPWKTPTHAQTELLATGHGSDGSRVLLLQGEVWPDVCDMYCQGASFARPHMVSTYWHDYGNATGVQGARAVLNPDYTTGVAAFVRTGGGSRPTNANYVIIDSLDAGVPDGIGGDCSGFVSLMPDSHWMFIDCVSHGCRDGMVVATQDGISHHISIVRCGGYDAYADAGPVVGLFIAQVDHACLISECSFDRCGYLEPTLTYGDVRSRNVYISDGMCPVCYWGGFNFRSASEGVQLRGGGCISDVIFDRCPVAGYIAKAGGRIAMNINLRPKGLDYWISETSTGATNEYYGWGWIVLPDESAIVECNAVGPPLYPGVLGRFMVGYRADPFEPSYATRVISRNNTGIDTLAESHEFGNYGAPIVPTYARITSRRNLATKANAPYYIVLFFGTPASYGGFGWNDSDANCYVTANPSQFASFDSGTDLRSLAAYTAATGQGANTNTNAPSFVDAAADLGDWYASSGGSNDIDAFYTAVRERAPRIWPAWMDSIDAVKFFLARYQATNLPSVAGDVLGMFGAPTEDPSYLNPGPRYWILTWSGGWSIYLLDGGVSS